MAENYPYSSPDLSKANDAPRAPNWDQPGGYQQGYDQRPSYPQQQYGPPPLPPINAGWAVAAVLFFWPLAFSAFNHSSSVFPRWSTGDYQGAQYASDRARTLGKYALWVFVALIAVFVAFYVVIIAVAVSVGSGNGTF